MTTLPTTPDSPTPVYHERRLRKIAARQAWASLWGIPEAESFHALAKHLRVGVGYLKTLERRGGTSAILTPELTLLYRVATPDFREDDFFPHTPYAWEPVGRGQKTRLNQGQKTRLNQGQTARSNQPRKGGKVTPKSAIGARRKGRKRANAPALNKQNLAKQKHLQEVLS